MKMNKWQLASFIVCALAPIVYLFFRHNLFNTTETTSVSISLWGFLAIIIFTIVVIIFCYYVISGLKTRYFWWKHVVIGFASIILPLTVCYLGLSWLSDNIDYLKEFILVTIGCEAVAIIINPMPKWMFENNIEGFCNIINRAFNKEAKGDK